LPGTRKENLIGRGEGLEFFLHMEKESLLSFGVEGVFEAQYHVIKSYYIHTKPSAQEHFVGKARVEVSLFVVRIIFYVPEIRICLEVN
jgi:hypothetical protein